MSMNPHEMRDVGAFEYQNLKAFLVRSIGKYQGEDHAQISMMLATNFLIQVIASQCGQSDEQVMLEIRRLITRMTGKPTYGKPEEYDWRN